MAGRVGLLAVGIAAVIAGSRSFAAIGQWAADAGPAVLTELGAARGPTQESTFRRAFALVSQERLEQVLGARLWTRAVRAEHEAAGTHSCLQGCVNSVRKLAKIPLLICDDFAMREFTAA